MNIFGLYDITNKEQCLRVGALNEIALMYDLSSREITRALKKHNLIRRKI